MSRKPRATIYGSVPDFGPSFKDGKFQPFNAAYSVFKPSPEPVEGPCGAILEVFEGEWFSVQAVGDRHLPNEFLDYHDALARSRGSGDHGSTAYILICEPAEDFVITARDSEGNDVPVFRRPQYKTTRIADRLIFPNR